MPVAIDKRPRLRPRSAYSQSLARRLAADFVGELSLDERERDTKTLYATVRTLEILGAQLGSFPRC